MRAISVFSLEAGTSSFWWRARIALRRRVRKSATGSVKLIVSPSSPVRSGFPENLREWFVTVDFFVNQSEFVYVADASRRARGPYQLDFTTPGISPLSAS